MADRQIEDLTAITALASGDEFLINDVSDTSSDAGGTPKRIVASDVKLFMSGLTLDSEYNAGSGNTSKTLVVGKITPIDLGANNGGNLNANVTITLPSASAGDVCGFFITRATNQTGSFPLAPGYCAEIANSTRINDAVYTSVATGSGKFGLWLPGEFLIFRYLDTNYGSGTAGWYLENDGRIRHVCLVYKTANQTTTDGAWTTVQVDTVSIDNANLFDSANYAIKLKRTNRISGNVVANPTITGVTIWGSRIYDGVATAYQNVITPGSATLNTPTPMTFENLPYSLNTVILMQSFMDVASGSPTVSGGLNGNRLSITEILT